MTLVTWYSSCKFSKRLLQKHETVSFTHVNVTALNDASLTEFTDTQNPVFWCISIRISPQDLISVPSMMQLKNKQTRNLWLVS